MPLALEELGLTKEDLIERVIERLTERLDEESTLFTTLSERAHEMVYERLSTRVNAAVDEQLRVEMTNIMAEKITPVNVWGEIAGEETTLREALRQRAREFWEVKIDKDGRPNKYGGTERYKTLMQQLLKDEFSAAVRENAGEIVAAFKAAVKGNLQSMVNEHIEKLIPSRR